MYNFHRFLIEWHWHLYCELVMMNFIYLIHSRNDRSNIVPTLGFEPRTYHTPSVCLTYFAIRHFKDIFFVILMFLWKLYVIFFWVIYKPLRLSIQLFLFYKVSAVTTGLVSGFNFISFDIRFKNHVGNISPNEFSSIKIKTKDSILH